MRARLNECKERQDGKKEVSESTIGYEPDVKFLQYPAALRFHPHLPYAERF